VERIRPQTFHPSRGKSPKNAAYFVALFDKIDHWQSPFFYDEIIVALPGKNGKCMEKQDRQMVERIDRLIREIQREPFAEVGKPEALKHAPAGY